MYARVYLKKCPSLKKKERKRNETKQNKTKQQKNKQWLKKHNRHMSCNFPYFFEIIYRFSQA